MLSYGEMDHNEMDNYIDSERIKFEHDFDHAPERQDFFYEQNSR